MMTTTMKSLCFCLLASTASAWTTAPFASLRPSLTTLQAARVDSSTAVADALKASKEFGATSIEARLAWEAVEDMDAADNSAAMEGGLDDECDISDEEKSAKCAEYDTKMEELKAIVGDFHISKFDQMKSLATEMKSIKMVVESAPKTDSPEQVVAMKKAVADAKAASEEHGATSSEAKVAWAEVEEIASAGLQNAVGARLDQECLVETAMEACQALEELSNALSKAKSSSDNLASF